jgi:hypothetical protein
MSEGTSENPHDAFQGSSGSDPEAQAKVSGPAMGLMVTAGIGIALQLLGIVMNLMGMGAGAAGGNGEDAMFTMMSGTVGLVSGVIGIIVGVVVFMGAQKMKALESYGFALTSAILAMIPCISPCCVIGLPIGIWALVVLNNDAVKAAFRS